MKRQGVVAPERPSAAPRDGFVNLAGMPFHYVDWGHNGRPMVLVHGTGFHAYTWKPLAKLVAHRFRVLAFDQRGHGDSAKPPSGYAWNLLADDLAGFLEALDLRDVLAVGHSAGGTAVAGVAARYPGRISQAVLVDPILLSPPPGVVGLHNPMADRARKRRMVWESRTSMFHSYRLREPFNTWQEDVLWAYIEEGTTLDRDGKVTLKCPGTIEAQVFDNVFSIDGFALLPKIQVPVLLMRGEHSDAFPPDGFALAKSLLPNCRPATAAGASHFVPMERPDLIEAAIREFVEF